MSVPAGSTISPSLVTTLNFCVFDGWYAIFLAISIDDAIIKLPNTNFIELATLSEYDIKSIAGLANPSFSFAIYAATYANSFLTSFAYTSLFGIKYACV